MRRSIVFLLICFMLPVSAQAWWNEDWQFRKQITLDTTAVGADIAEPLTDVPVLVRLHTGNFGYFLDIMAAGEDIRFIADDDKTPLEYHIEKFDPINEMALIWVRIPELPANAATRSIWMYYGNAAAVDAQDAAGSFGAREALAYHFMEGEAAPRDATAYGNHVGEFSAALHPAALIGHGVVFDGNGALVVPDAPSLGFTPEDGWTWSAWVKVDAGQSGAVLLERGDAAGRLSLTLEELSVIARVEADGTLLAETPGNAALSPGNWHHLALRLQQGRLALFLDGVETAFVETELPPLQGDLRLGMAADGEGGFIGALDEMRVSNTARSAAWIRAAVSGQGPASSLLVYGEDGQQEGGGESHSYFAVTLANVTVDGWVVIVMLAIMAAISWVVMVSKGLVIRRTRKDNARFQQAFARLSAGEVDALDDDSLDEDDDGNDSPLLTALSGRHDHFESSPIYRIYHAAVQEMHHRTARAVGAQAADLELSPQAVNAIRATMDSALVRENQKLNSQMVLLTIAISGGPFLGLLGTVVGVMITFASIAASGDVDVNAIAPGIAAALVATVAGLAVAIPALFGYNYLSSRIKEISADMRVFADEFVAKVAEQHS